MGRVVCEDTSSGKDHQVRVGERIGEYDGGLYGELFFGSEINLLAESSARFPLHPSGNAIEDFDTLGRVLPDRGFSTEHDSVGLLENRVGDIGDFRPCWNRVLDHRLEHMSGHNDFSSYSCRFLENTALYNR